MNEATRPYPEGFQLWSPERQDEYFAEAARSYRARTIRQPVASCQHRTRKRRASGPCVLLEHRTRCNRMDVARLVGARPAAPLGRPAWMGKTTLALAFAATISAGGPWPDGSRAKRGNVIIWSGEDDPRDTLVPRLEAASADRSRVQIVNGISGDGPTRAFDPARDMGALAGEIKKVRDVRLVIIDPVAMVATKDSHRNAETRRDLQPLADLCRETGAAALGIHHLAKGSAGREPQEERLIGSIAFAALGPVDIHLRATKAAAR